MKTLLVSPDYPPPFVGGSLVYMYNLVAESRVDVFTSRLPPGVQEITPGQGRILRSPFLSRSARPTRLQLLVMYLHFPVAVRRLMKVGGYDAVLLAAGVIGNCLLLLSLPRFRCPRIVFAFAEELTIPLHSHGLKNLIKRAALSIAYRQATRVVAVCRFTKDVLQSIGVPADRVVVIPPMIAEVRNSDGQSYTAKSGRRILSVGRLVKRKGFNHLLRALDLLRQEMPEVHLTIAGDGPERQALEHLVAEGGLQSHVFFCGEVPDAQLSHLFGTADVFVLANIELPNGDCEGCPTVLLEASAHARPVVAGSSGGTANAVEHGKTGFLVDPTDELELAEKIKILLCDPVLRRDMGLAGRAKVDRDHRPSVGASHLEAVIGAVINAS